MNLPQGYELRPQQKETIDLIERNIDNKFFILNLPTGSGKSLIAETIALNNSSTIITKTKYLQEQYLKEFEYHNIKGMANYICEHNCHYNSVECAEKKNEKCKEKCPYIIARNNFKQSSKRLTNFSYFFRTHLKKEEKTEFLIIDEAHNFGEELISSLTLTFDYYKLLEMFEGYMLPKVNVYAEQHINTIKEKIIYMEETGKFNDNDISPFINDLLSETFGVLDTEKAYEKLKNKDLNFFLEMKSLSEGLEKLENKNIIKYEKTNLDEVYVIQPVFPSQLKEFWMDKAEKFIFMSATIGSKDYFEKELGIKDSIYYEVESPFPKENRKIIYRPSYNFVYREKEEALSILLKIIDRIVENHKDENGIIHTPSFSLAWDIKKNSKHGRKMVIPNSPMEVEKYKGKGKIIVGPNFYEGVDFKDDYARWQIISKMPYTEITNPYVKYRMNVDKDWYNNNTLKRLEQTIGRIVRSKDDYGITYIFDKQFERFIKKLPKYTREAIKQV